MFEYTLKAARRYDPMSVDWRHGISIVINARTQREAENAATTALGEPGPGAHWVIRMESIRQTHTLARVWDEGYTVGFYAREGLSGDSRDASEGGGTNPYTTSRKDNHHD